MSQSSHSRTSETHVAGDGQAPAPNYTSNDDVGQHGGGFPMLNTVSPTQAPNTVDQTYHGNPGMNFLGDLWYNEEDHDSMPNMAHPGQLWYQGFTGASTTGPSQPSLVSQDNLYTGANYATPNAGYPAELAPNYQAPNADVEASMMRDFPDMYGGDEQTPTEQSDENLAQALQDADNTFFNAYPAAPPTGQIDPPNVQNDQQGHGGNGIPLDPSWGLEQPSNPVGNIGGIAFDKLTTLPVPENTPLPGQNYGWPWTNNQASQFASHFRENTLGGGQNYGMPMFPPNAPIGLGVNPTTRNHGRLVTRPNASTRTTSRVDPYPSRGSRPDRRQRQTDRTNASPPSSPHPRPRQPKPSRIPPKDYVFQLGSRQAANEYLYGRKYEPYLDPAEDSTIATVQNNEQTHIRQIFDAITNLENIEDAPGARDRTYMQAGHKNYDPLRIEAASIRIFEALLNRCTIGYTGRKEIGHAAPWDLRPGNGREQDVSGTCKERLDNVIWALSINKTLCRDVLNTDERITSLVDAPLWWAGKKREFKRLNQKKKADLEAGKAAKERLLSLDSQASTPSSGSGTGTA